MPDIFQTITGGFFDSVNHDRLYSAEQMNMPYKKLITDGIILNENETGSPFEVTAAGGMIVNIGAGNALIGGKWAENEETMAVEISGNTSGAARIDSIILRLDKSIGTRAVGIVYRQGAATAPALETSAYVKEFRLANITVADNAAAITAANITDTRGGSECPYVTSIFDPPEARYIIEEYNGSELAGSHQTVKSAINSIRYAAQSGQPTVAMQAADMTEHDKVYLYEGSEDGYDAGYLYYYSATDSAWIRGAQYGTSVVDTDLDADSENPVQNKAVTAAITGLNGRLEELEQTGGSGASVPTEVRQALYRLFDSNAFLSSAGFTSDIAVLQSWAMEITEITLNQSIISISGTGTSQLTAVTVPAGGLVTWSSSNPAVATVSSTGLVTGVSNGTARIIASCGGKNATCNVIVSGFATLTSITATFTQSGAVYDTDTLDSLKASLVVTANYDNSTSESVSDYTLSGTLAEGTSTITASYGGFTDTFSVVVTRIVSEEIINQYTPYDSLNTTTFENVTGSVGSNNIVTDAGTINASKVRFQWDTDECNLFQIQICQYDSSGTPYKMSNLNKYGTAPITSGDAFDTTTGAWSNVGITPKFTAIAGGDITVNLPTSGKFRLQLRKTNQSTGTEVSDNATFKNWVEGDGITITAIL